MPQKHNEPGVPRRARTGCVSDHVAGGGNSLQPSAGSSGGQGTRGGNDADRILTPADLEFLADLVGAIEVLSGHASAGDLPRLRTYTAHQLVGLLKARRQASIGRLVA
jgi:hypothetical protein